MAVWIKIFRHLWPGISLSLFPSFRFYLISLANGNFLGRTAWRGLWSWQREIGKTPRSGRLLSSFFLFCFYCLPPSRFSQRERKRVKKWKGEVRGGILPPFWCSGFLKVRQALSGTFAAWGVKSVLTWQGGWKWQKETHVVNWVLLMVSGMWLLACSVLVTLCRTFRNLPVLF